MNILQVIFLVSYYGRRVGIFQFGVFINDINVTSLFVSIIPLLSNKQSPPHQSLIIIQSCLRSSIHYCFFTFLKIVWAGEEVFLGDLK